MIEDGRKEESDWNYRASPDLVPDRQPKAVT